MGLGAISNVGMTSFGFAKCWDLGLGQGPGVQGLGYWDPGLGPGAGARGRGPGLGPGAEGAGAGRPPVACCLICILAIA